METTFDKRAMMSRWKKNRTFNKQSHGNRVLPCRPRNERSTAPRDLNHRPDAEISSRWMTDLGVHCKVTELVNTRAHTHTENHPELGEAFLHFTPKSQPIKGKIYRLIKMKTFLSVKDPAERMKRQAEPAGNNCKPPGRVSGTHDELTKPNDSARNPARAAGPRGKRTADAHADGAPESRAARGRD